MYFFSAIRAPYANVNLSRRDVAMSNTLFMRHPQSIGGRRPVARRAAPAAARSPHPLETPRDFLVASPADSGDTPGMNATAMQAGDTVKFTRPQDAREAAARFKLVEDRGDRVLIELICNLPIRPTECVATVEIQPAD
jgi:hypothetical protein